MPQTKAFFRFLPVVVVLYIGKCGSEAQSDGTSGNISNGEGLVSGFLTTFTLLARDRMSLQDMSWLLVKVFFGYVGEEPLFATACSS